MPIAPREAGGRLAGGVGGGARAVSRVGGSRCPPSGVGQPHWSGLGRDVRAVRRGGARERLGGHDGHSGHDGLGGHVGHGGHGGYGGAAAAAAAAAVPLARGKPYGPAGGGMGLGGAADGGGPGEFAYHLGAAASPGGGRLPPGR